MGTGCRLWPGASNGTSKHLTGIRLRKVRLPEWTLVANDFVESLWNSQCRIAISVCVSPCAGVA